MTNQMLSSQKQGWSRNLVESETVHLMMVAISLCVSSSLDGRKSR
jgi:hypothetical protein